MFIENNYYPFGLKHKGYNNAPLTNHPYKYNGKELNEELGLDWYDLGARMLDPALGRFMTIDPMADFVNSQSPYSVADNNPIGYIDAYGFGSTPWWLRWLVGGSAKNCSCKQRQGVIGAIGKLFEPKAKKKRRSKKRKKNKKSKSSSSNTTTSSTTNDNPRDAVTGLDFSSQGLVDITPDIPAAQISFASPATSLPTPEFNNRPIPVGRTVTFGADVKFKSSSNTFRDIDHTEKILSDLLKTLKEYPQLIVLIKGNFSNPTPGLTQSSSAQVNGRDGTVGQLQLERARAVEQFLINRGINWRRILVGNGEIHPGGQDNMNSTFILKNPNN